MYLAAIRQGNIGQWKMTDNYTSEPTNPTWYYWYYPVLGQLTKFLNIEPYIIYFISKIIMAELIFITSYILSGLFLSGIWQVHGALFSLVMTVFPYYFFTYQVLSEYFPWWYRFDALSRIDTMPHYLASWAFQNIAYILFFSQIKSVNFSKTLLIFLISMASGLFMPAGVISLAIVIPVTGFFKFLLARKTLSFSKRLRESFLYIFMFLGSLIPLILIYRDRYKGFPWADWVQWDHEYWVVNAVNYFPKEIIYCYLPVFLLSIPALIYGFKKKSWSVMILFIWAILSIILIQLSPVFDLGTVRSANIESWLPFGIIAASGLSILARKSKLTAYGLMAVYYIGSVVVSASIFQYTLLQAQTFPLHEKMYIPKKRLSVIKQLDNLMPHHSVVLTEFITGQILPVFSNQLTYLGHMVQTQDYFTKAGLVNDFYSERMSSAEALKFLKSNNISYIIFEPVNMSFNFAKYDYLTKIFALDEYYVYKVN